MDGFVLSWVGSETMNAEVPNFLCIAVPSVVLFRGAMDLSLQTQLVIWITFFAAGMVKGVTGMGLPTVAMGVLGALISPLSAASLLLAPSLVTNVWQMAAGTHLAPLARRFWPMVTAIAIGTVFSSGVLARGSSETTTTALGCALAAYAAYTLLAGQLTVSPRLEKTFAPVIGLATGLVTGATGVLVIPAVPFLQALRLERDEFVQALGMSFTASTISLTMGLWYFGVLTVEHLPASTLAIVPALLGMVSGQLLRARISQQLFRYCFLILMLLLGLEMLLRPLVQ